MASPLPPADAVRIKVIRHCNLDGISQCCKFSVDPQLTTLSVLQNLVVRAFKLTSREFEISYLSRDERLPEALWLPLVSDFDLELAFSRPCEPHLLVKVEAGRSGSFSSTGSWEGLDIVPRLPHLTAAAANNYSTKLPGIFREKMEKTLGLMQRALNWPDDLLPPAGDARQPLESTQKDVAVMAPMDDVKFQSFLDNVGVLIKVNELRKTIYMAGLEPSLRKVVWKHLLDVYPAGLPGKERLEYMKTKTAEYHSLRQRWQHHVKHSEQVCEEVTTLSNMVRKDTLRTDRHHPHYSGRDDNPNTTALFNILTTYSLNHPGVGYCQGMSDLASPLLFTQRDEAHAYVCFCALMARLSANFHVDGAAMSLKFQHLTEALVFYDPDFYLYLQEHQADDLLFCYRWLLLELKREFAFDDAQLMLEVLWSSLPPRPPSHTLPLAEVPFDPEALVRAAKNAAALATSSPLPALASARLLSQLRNGKRVSNYSAVCALRRQRSSEAALLTRRSSSRSVQLTRAASQPLKPFMNGAADASDGVSTEAGVKLTTAGVSDDVFTSVKSSAAGDVKSGSAGDALGYIEANVTPTRKIKNLKEFMELGRSSKKSSRSEQDSPSRSSGISENASPLKTNHDAQLSYPSPSKPTSNELIPHHLEYTVGTTNDPIVSKLTSCDNSIASPNVDSSSSPAHSNSTKMKIQNDGASKPNVKSNKTFSTFQTPEVPDATSKIEGIRAPASCLSTGSNGSDCAHRVPSDGSSLQDAVGDYCSLGGSSSSSVLCAVECSRRCFSESDAAFANFLDSDAVAAEEELCVEVWENPVASSPVNAPTVSLRPARSVIPNSHTDGDVAKLLKEDTGAGARLVPAKPSPSHTSPVSGKSSVMNDLSGGWAVGVGGVGLNGGSLPPPHEFGGGNPFLMIVCVSILLQHRDTIISQQLDHNDLAMHFDKLMRKHDVHHVLRDARLRYKHYCSLSFQKTDAVNKHEQC